MVTPSSLIPETPLMLFFIPLLLIGIFVLIIVLVVRRLTKGSKYAQELKAKISDGSFPKEQFQELDKLITEKGGLQRDLLSANEWYGTIGTISYSLSRSTRANLYAGSDDHLPSAMTDMRFYLSIGGFGPASLRRLVGIIATKMLKDDITLTMLDGEFTVRLNGEVLGVVDIVGKRILDKDQKPVAELITPSNLYISSINGFRREVSWKAVFGEGKEAKLLSQKGNINPFKNVANIPVAELSPELSKEERALVFGFYMFLKLQSLLNPNNYRSISS